MTFRFSVLKKGGISLKRRLKFYKTLDETGFSCFGGEAEWSLPRLNDDGTWIPGEWMPPIEYELVECKNGYHIATFNQLLHWLAPRIFEAEAGREVIRSEYKYISRRCRLLREFTNWNEQAARLFACNCVERVLPLYEKRYQNDTRLRDAINEIRLFVDSQNSGKPDVGILSHAFDKAREVEKSDLDDVSRYIASAVSCAAWTHDEAAEDARKAIERCLSAVYEFAIDKALARRLSEDATLKMAQKARKTMEKWQLQRLRQILEGGVSVVVD